MAQATKENKQLVAAESTVTAAINALQRNIPFLSDHDDACYQIIMDLLQEDEDLNLIDDYNAKHTPKSDEDINKKTDDMLETFVANEMKEYAQTLQSHDDIGVMDWDKIIECVRHEMWPKLGSIMKGILRLNKKEMTGCEVKEEDIKIVLNALEKKGIAVESLEYLKALIQRAIHLNANANQYRHGDERANENDFEALLNDIWSVYKCYRFTQSNFTEYSFDQFNQEITERARQFKSFTNIQIKHDKCHLYPQYLIDDDIFGVFQYHFAVSSYVNYLKNTMHIEAQTPFKINAVVIPSAVSSVYDPNATFKYGIDEIDKYLVHKKAYGSIVFRFKRDEPRDITDIVSAIQYHIDLKDIELVGASSMYLFIDRRMDHYDSMYILLSAKPRNFEELYTNNFVSFSYKIRRENAWNVVSAHLRYGIGYKMRFYPEMLTSFVPRLFRMPKNTSMADYLKRMHSNQFKHNWCVNLNDIVFNHYFKMFCGLTHVSVNYNRIVLAKELGDTTPLLHFRQLVDHQLECARIDCNDIDRMNAFLDVNGYETDSILVDVARGFNITQHLESNGKKEQLMLIKQLTHAHQGPAESNKVCGTHTIKDPMHCGYVAKIIDALKEFKANADNVSLGLVDLETLRDHILSHHGYLDKTSDDNVRQYIMEKVGECTVPHCQVLQQHIMRRRETDDKKEEDTAVNGLNEMVKAILNALHSHCLHKTQELYRLKRNTQQNHFVTTLNKAKETEGNPLGSINFGVSVLNWFEFGEEPEETSLRIAIVSNPESTISHELYLTYSRECYLRLLSKQFKADQWLLDEIIAVKCYTDTNAYCSALRRAHWSSATLAQRKDYYQWAITLYRAALFHALPIPRATFKSKAPRALYHGINRVFVIEDGFPKYNGPTSTTLAQSVGHSFSDGVGLLWTISPSYRNPWKRVLGIDVKRITHHENEEEVLLVDQYLPITSTQKFVDDVKDNVDHLMYTLKEYRKFIINKAV
eukprot:1121750_1